MSRRPRRRPSGCCTAAPTDPRAPSGRPGSDRRSVDVHEVLNTTLRAGRVDHRLGGCHGVSPALTCRFATGRTVISGPSTSTKWFVLWHVRSTLVDLRRRFQRCVADGPSHFRCASECPPSQVASAMVVRAVPPATRWTTKALRPDEHTPENHRQPATENDGLTRGRRDHRSAGSASIRKLTPSSQRARRASEGRTG